VIFQLNIEISSLTVSTTFISLDLEVLVMLNLAAFTVNLATVILPAIPDVGTKVFEEF
jgi:energy-converting hydrogenase Eha subunit E